MGENSPSIQDSVFHWYVEPTVEGSIIMNGRKGEVEGGWGQIHTHVEMGYVVLLGKVSWSEVKIY